MATITAGYSWVSGEVVTPAKMNSAAVPTITNIVNADVADGAAIALSKLATGALPTAITVASANLVDGTIVNADVAASAAIDGTKINPLVASGTYTPTLTGVTNIASSTSGSARWSRVGSIVTVSGRALLGFTAAAESAFTLSLPVATTFTSAEEASGTINIGTATSARGYGAVASKATTGLVDVFVYPTHTTTGRHYYYVFQYQVI